MNRSNPVSIAVTNIAVTGLLFLAAWTAAFPFATYAAYAAGVITAACLVTGTYTERLQRILLHLALPTYTVITTAWLPHNVTQGVLLTATPVLLAATTKPMLRRAWTAVKDAAMQRGIKSLVTTNLGIPAAAVALTAAALLVTGVEGWAALGVAAATLTIGGALLTAGSLTYHALTTKDSFTYAYADILIAHLIPYAVFAYVAGGMFDVFGGELIATPILVLAANAVIAGLTTIKAEPRRAGTALAVVILLVAVVTAHQTTSLGEPSTYERTNVISPGYTVSHGAITLTPEGYNGSITVRDASPGTYHITVAYDPGSTPESRVNTMLRRLRLTYKAPPLLEKQVSVNETPATIRFAGNETDVYDAYNDTPETMTWQNAANQPLLTTQVIADDHRDATAYASESDVSLSFGRLFDGTSEKREGRIVLKAKNDVSRDQEPRPTEPQSTNPKPADEAEANTGNDQARTDPRIAYWCGKVNQHREKGEWRTDPDGVSGCNEDKLAYCQEFYPETTSVEPAGKERITEWRSRGNTGNSTATKQTYRCVQPKT